MRSQMVPWACRMMLAMTAEPTKVPTMTQSVTRMPRQPIFLNSAQSLPMLTPA